jgi:hypothetical protein
MEIRTKLAAVAAAAMLLTVTNPVNAQRYSFDFGVNGGFAGYTSSLTDTHIGSSAGDIKFSNGYIIGTQLTWWGFPRLLGSRAGLRLNGTYSDRPWDQSLDDTENMELFGHVNLWSGTGDLMFGFAAPRESWSGMEFLPYLALGAGLKWINPAGDIQTATDAEEGKSWAGVTATCAAGRCVGARSRQPNADRGFFLGENGRFLALAGLGGDLRFSPNIALRLEVGDRMWKAPIYQMSPPIPAAPLATFNIINDTEVGKMIHEFYGQVGVHMLFGLVAPPAPVAVAPAPPPVVSRPTPPPPPPAPREDAIRVCVIDPSGEMGIRTVDATFLPASGDTLITVNGQRVALRSTTGNVMVASNASWFVQGQPLTLRLGRENAGFVTFGTSRVVSADDLAYLGTSNGVPVYADREDVGDVMSELRELRRAQNRTDLKDILDEQGDIRDELKDLKVLYVPLQPTGCVFQPLQRQETVRKVRG